MDTLIGILAVFALVFVNGFFVAAEFGLVGARQTRISQLAAEGNAGAIAAADAIEHLDSYIAATQLGITLASLGLGWIGEPAIGHLIEGIFASFLPEEVLHTVGATVSVAVAFAMVTVLHIVLGELAPKTIALQRPEMVSIFVARPTRVFLMVFRPVIYVMNGLGNFVVRLMGFEPVGGHAQVHSAEELEMLVKSSRQAGLLQESEERLLRRVFDFSDIQAREVMQPRVEVDAIPVDMPLPKLLQVVAGLTHSRFPVYDGTIDKVVGILHTRDLFDLTVHNPELLTTLDAAKFDLPPLLRSPLFVPETAGVDKLLEKMQKTKTQFAVIIDEYGGMAGVVTMEDILEQLIGQVQDEFDVEEADIETEGEASVIDGLVSITEVTDRFGEPGIEPLSNTVGGYLAERLDRIPVQGDKVLWGTYDLVAEEMDGMRVAKVRFIPRPKPSSGETPSKESSENTKN